MFWKNFMHLKSLQRILGKNPHESVFFYTFHKCASTLFGDFVLKNIKDLRHIDYAGILYNGENVNVIFEPYGFIYGPIRLSTNPMTPMHKKLVAPTSNTEFIRNKIAIILVRDPRDILVSSYYSFGYTHGRSPVKEIRDMQEQRRSKIISETIDEYVLEVSSNIFGYFETANKLSKACNRSVVLRYEDMIDNWSFFVKDLTKHIDIDQTILTQIYEKSRPLEKKNNASHRRSGKPEGFRSELKGETIKSLNTTFETVLQRFQYTP